MKRIFTLLLALVMTLALAAPALAAEDVFEAPEAGEAAAPEAPEAPVEEAPVVEAPVVEAPAEAPDMPQAAAVEPEDTPVPDDTTETEPQTGKLTILGDLDMLWWVRVSSDAGRTDYAGEFDAADIPIQEGDVVLLTMDYRYTAELDKEWPSMERRGIMNGGTPSGEHVGDVANVVGIGVTAEDGCDLTITIMEDPEVPAFIPVTWTAPEGVYVKTNEFALSDPDYYGSFTCDAGYVPFFTGADPESSYETEDGHVVTSFAPYDDVESIQVDVRKATGYLNLTGFTDKVLLTLATDDYLAVAEPSNGIVGGMRLVIGVEQGYSLKSDVAPDNETYLILEGVNTHLYAFDVPAAGDINVEVVKTVPDEAMPASGTGWAYDEATGDYYYFVNGDQKFDYWASSQRGLWYYIDSNGKLATGFQYVENPNGTGWYMFQTDNTNGCIGRMLTGWQWTWSKAGMGWFNTAHGGLNGQCTYTTQWGAYDAATGMWADGIFHHGVG